MTAAARFDLDEIKASTSLTDLFGRLTELVPAGRGKFMARCPLHDDGTPSLSIDAAKGLWRCHGCGAGGDAIKAAQLIFRLPFVEAVKALAEGAAMAPAVQAPPQPRADDEGQMIRAARWIWGEARPDPMIGTYLRSRGINIPPPPTMRFHPALHHGPTGLKLPAMIGAVTRWPGRAITGVHRTWMTEDGRKAPVSAPKMTLGACKGGAIRLAPAGPVLVIGEGIETVFSVMEATGLPGWAAMNASNLAAIALPDEAREIIIAADNDASGTGEREARKAADRFAAEGRKARIIIPDQTGTDFNDIAREALEHG